MNTDRATRVWTAIARQAQRDGSPVSPKHACLACVEVAGVSGAALVLTSNMNTLEPVYVTDSRAGEVEELQATVGQGPGIDALTLGVPTLVDDLNSLSGTRRWPLFTPEATGLGVRAMYSFPLALGAIHVGYLQLYREFPGELSQDQLVDALVFADTALLLVLDARAGIVTALDNGAGEASRPTLWHAEVHQAAGMVSVQLGIPVVDALVRLRAYAYSHDLRLTEVARSVVERRLRFQPGDAGPATKHAREGEA